MVDLEALDLDIEDNRIILTAADHETAVRFAAALVRLFMSFGDGHVLVKDDDDKPTN